MITCTRMYGGLTIESDHVMTPSEMIDHLKSEGAIPPRAQLGAVRVHAQHDREEVYWLWHLSWHVPNAGQILHAMGARDDGGEPL